MSADLAAAGSEAAGVMTASAASGAGDAEFDALIVDVERQLMVLAGAVRRSWRRLAEDVHPDLQLTGLKILRTLAADGPAHAKDLVDVIGCDKSVLSRQIAQLEQLGLIERQVDEHDARARRVAASPDALARLARARAARKDESRRLLSTWTPAELTTFATLLTRLTSPVGH